MIGDGEDQRSAGQQGVVLLLIKDLGFRSRITAAAAALGVGVRTVRDEGALAAASSESRISGAILDLGAPGFGEPELLDRLVAAVPPARIVAIFPHVEKSLKEAAESRGITRVLPRSKVVQELDEILLDLAPAPGAAL